MGASVCAILAFFILRIKDAEERGRFLQKFDQLIKDNDRHEGRISALIGAHEELEHAYIEQRKDTAQLQKVLEEIRLDLKELIKEHNCRGREGMD
jgi:DNA repair exonuclease SbcCD ATPase subunit